MKFNCTSPCKNCPYRTDAPLRLWDREEFRKLLEHDKDPFGKVYDCHKNNGSICRGYLMDQDERNHPNINLRMMLSKHGVTRTYLDALACSSPMYASIEEMIAANFPDLLIEDGLR
jgi:hypothetical protein